MDDGGTTALPPPRPLRWRSVVVPVTIVSVATGLLVAVGATLASAATVDVNAWYVLVNRNRWPDLVESQRRHPSGLRPAGFSYSTDGVNFTSLGPAFTLNNTWQFFMGYRFDIFNYATQALGGAVTVKRFDRTTP